MTALTAVFLTNRAHRPASAIALLVAAPVPSAVPVPVRAPEQTVRLP